MDNFISILKDIGTQFIATVPKLFGALIVAIAGYILAKVASRIVETILDKVGIDKMAEKLNEIDIVNRSGIDFKLSKLFGTITFVTLLVFGLMFATNILAIDVVSEMMGKIIFYVPKVIAALFLLIIGLLLAEAIKNIVTTTCNSLGIPSGKIIATFVFYLVFLTMLISALAQVDIATDLITSNLTVLLAGIVFAFSLGYGFASKDTMANFLASFYSKRKLQIGDVISLDGVKGKIIEIDSTSLTLETGASVVIIPLKKLTSERVEIFRE